MSPNRDSFPAELYRRLADGRAHSGPELAAELGMTRAAIWKQVERLREMGLDVVSEPRRGYRVVDPPRPLDQDRIADSLPEDEVPPRLEVFASLPSTNAYLMEDRDAVSGTVCLAEHQSGGRGRRGRVWQSPYGAGVWLSMVWRFESLGTAAGGLALAVGAAAADALRGQGVSGIGLKWPNDLMVASGGSWAKLGGVLVELAGEAGGHARVVAGIGVNHRLPDGPVTDQPATDIHRSASPVPERVAVAAALITALARAFRSFEARGLAPALERWRAADLLRDRAIRIQDGERTWDGIARGVADDGALRVETPAGLTALRGGEVSLRMVESG